MKNKILLVYAIIMITFFVISCEGFWQVQRSQDISFTISREKVIEIFTETQSAIRTIDGDEDSKNLEGDDNSINITISIHNANDDNAVASKSIVLYDDEKVNVEFSSLNIIGKSIYAKIETVIDGKTYVGSSEIIVVSKIVSNLLISDILPVFPNAYYVTDTTVASDETGDGSALKPFASVQKAVDEIIKINDEKTTYTIYIKGTITEEGQHPEFDDTHIDRGFVRFYSEKPLNIVLKGIGEGENAGIIDGLGGNHPMFYIEGAGANITLAENLTLTGANTTSSLAGGVWLMSGTFNMIGGEISGNFAVGAGAVYLSNRQNPSDPEGVFNLSGGKIINNACRDDYYSGGIQISGGVLNVSGVPIIKENKTESSYNRDRNFSDGIISNIEISTYLTYNPVKIVGPLLDEAEIGITLNTQSSIPTTVVVESGDLLDGSGKYIPISDDDVAAFLWDNDGGNFTLNSARDAIIVESVNP